MGHFTPQMSAVRKKFLRVFLPIFLSVSLIPLIALCVLMAIDEEKYAIFVIVWTWIVFVGGLSCLSFLPWLNRKEALESALKHYAFLTKEPEPMAEDSVRIESPYEEGVRYLLTADGVAVEWDEEPQREEQVFDEIKENLRFVPWKEATLSLATQARGLFADVALAVLFDETQDGMEGYALFIPMTEEVYKALHAFGLNDQLGAEWDYLRYNPQDALWQILKKGRVITMRNRKTGKLFVDKYGNFIAENEEKE